AVIGSQCQLPSAWVDGRSTRKCGCESKGDKDISDTGGRGIVVGLRRLAAGRRLAGPAGGFRCGSARVAATTGTVAAAGARTHAARAAGIASARAPGAGKGQGHGPAADRRVA